MMYPACFRFALKVGRKFIKLVLLLLCIAVITASDEQDILVNLYNDLMEHVSYDVR